MEARFKSLVFFLSICYTQIEMGKDVSSNEIFYLFIESAKVLKDNYECLLMPFFRPREVRCWKKMIYSLDMSEGRKDKLWNYLNGDIEYEELIKDSILDKILHK